MNNLVKKKKYLLLYEKWVKTGYIPGDGLCNCYCNGHRLAKHELMKLFEPFRKESERIWWAGEVGTTGTEYLSRFNPFRQNIILFMAAMNNEL